MRHRVFGHHLNQDSNSRQRLFHNLVYSFVKHGRLETTGAKADSVRGTIENLVTKVKRNTTNYRDELNAYLKDQSVVKKFTDEIVPKLVQRQGGYTRVINLRKRYGDNAEVVLLRWVFADKSLEGESKQLAVKQEDQKIIKAKEKTKVKKSVKNKT